MAEYLNLLVMLDPSLNTFLSLQDRLSSLLKTAENLKVKGLAEVSGEEKEKEKSEMKPSPGSAVSRLSSGPPPMTMMGRGGGSERSGQENNNMGGFLNSNGELKKKRGRPRTLDGPEDEDGSVFSPRISSVTGSLNGSSMSPILSQSLSSSAFLQTKTLSPLQAALSKPLAEAQGSKDNSNSSPPSSKPTTPCPSSPTTIKTESQDNNRCDTPGSASINGTFVPTLSAEKVASWGIIKMNDYLVSGTRQQYWEEYFVKNVMAVSREPVGTKTLLNQTIF